MVIDERTAAFIASMDKGNPTYLDALERFALQEQVPIIRKPTQQLLRFLMAMVKPKSILEVGTAIGFSALLMSEYAPADCRITTIEKYEQRIPVARENFAKAGRADRITLIEGDAADVLPTLAGPYDLIFMDAAKGQYIHFMPEVLRLLPQGGVLITDNVLREGDVLESHYAVARRDRTIHKRMRAYLLELKRNEQLDTTILAFADGAALSRKR